MRLLLFTTDIICEKNPVKCLNKYYVSTYYVVPDFVYQASGKT